MSSDRIVNFSAGPAAIPLEVLEEAQANLTNYKGAGLSVMEMSHRSKEYDEIHEKAIKITLCYQFNKNSFTFSSYEFQPRSVFM